MESKNQFIGSDMVGVEAVIQPRRGRPKSVTHAPQTSTQPYETSADAKTEAVSSGTGRPRVFIPVRYDTLALGIVFSREIQKDTFLCHTKREPAGTAEDFPADKIVWIFQYAGGQ